MTTLVTGCRGRVGRALVTRLHAQGRPVRAASSDPTTARTPDEVPVVHLAFDEPDSMPAALAWVSTVFLYAARAGVAAFLAAAEAAGVDHVVLLSSSSVTEPYADSDPIAQHHASVERELAEAAFPVTVLRPGAFATNALQWSREIAAGGPVELPYPNATGAPIDDTDIAAVAARLITDPTGRGKTYQLSGPESLTFAEQIDIIGAALGREVGVRRIEPSQARERLAGRMGPDFADVILSMWQRSANQPAEVANGVPTVLDRPARPFADWVRANLDAFRATE